MSESVHVDPPVVLDDAEHLDDAALYDRAKGRLDERRGLRAHALSFVLVNAFLVVVWAVGGGGDFWPVLPIAGWGIGLALHAWSVLSPEASREEVLAEVARLKGA